MKRGSSCGEKSNKSMHIPSSCTKSAIFLASDMSTFFYQPQIEQLFRKQKKNQMDISSYKMPLTRILLCLTNISKIKSTIPMVKVAICHRRTSCKPETITHE